MKIKCIAWDILILIQGRESLLAGTCFDWSSQGVTEDVPVARSLQPPGGGDGGGHGGTPGPGLGDEPRLGPLGVHQVHVVH